MATDSRDKSAKAKANKPEEKEKPVISEPADSEAKLLASAIQQMREMLLEQAKANEARFERLEKTMSSSRRDELAQALSAPIMSAALPGASAGDAKPSILNSLRLAVAEEKGTPKSASKKRKERKKRAEAKAKPDRGPETPRPATAGSAEAEAKGGVRQGDRRGSDDSSVPESAVTVSSNRGLSVDCAWTFAQAQAKGGFLQYSRVQVLPAIKRNRNRKELEFLSDLADTLVAELGLEPDMQSAQKLVKRLAAVAEYDRTNNVGFLDVLSVPEAGYLKPADQLEVAGHVVQHQKLDRQVQRYHGAQTGDKPSPAKPFFSPPPAKRTT